MTELSSPLLIARNLTRNFGRGGPLLGSRRVVKAVNDVSFHLGRGETLGLVGESGSGKSTTGRLALGLLRPSAGEVRFDGADILSLAGAAWRRSRRDMQMIFQDPGGALDERMTIGEQIAEVLAVHDLAPRTERQERTQTMLARVGLGVAGLDRRFPHELSGGQRQRAVIARALAMRPKLVVCDEPVSALDVSVQAQVVNLLIELQQEHCLSYLFISHDLRVVAHVSHRIAVMYLGRIVELADRQELLGTPLHPYTEALIASVPIVAHRASAMNRRPGVAGELPDPVNPPSGCAYRIRCPLAREICTQLVPVLVEAAPGHQVACHFVGPSGTRHIA